MNWRYPERVIAIDLETTGLSPMYDYITQIGAVVMDKGEPAANIEPFYSVVQPNLDKVKYSVQALSVQIGDLNDPANRAKLESWFASQFEAPTSREVAIQFAEWCKSVGAENLPNVAQKADFDYGFISNWQFQQQAAFKDGSLCPVWIDTVSMARRLAPGGPSKGYGLDALCVMFDIPKREGGHDALQDAILCGQVYERLRLRLSLEGL